MLTTFRQQGDVIDYTPGTDVDAGAIIVLGNIVGHVPVPIPANTLGAVTVEGVVRFPKGILSTDIIAVGAKVYWDAGASKATTTAASNKVAGYAVAAAAQTDTTVDVKLARA